MSATAKGLWALIILAVLGIAGVFALAFVARLAYEVVLLGWGLFG